MNETDRIDRDRPCAIKRRIAAISEKHTDSMEVGGHEVVAEEVASFLQRLNDRVSGWDGIILMGEVALLLRGYEEHHRARAERTKQAAAQVMGAMDRADEDTAAFESRTALEAEASLEKAERNAVMAQRLEDFVDQSIHGLSDGENPVEVLRGLAAGLAARMGLQVDHDAFDRARAFADQAMAATGRGPLSAEEAQIAGDEVRCVLCEDRAHQCEACARAQQELGR